MALMGTTLQMASLIVEDIALVVGNGSRSELHRYQLVNLWLDVAADNCLCTNNGGADFGCQPGGFVQVRSASCSVAKVAVKIKSYRRYCVKGHVGSAILLSASRGIINCNVQEFSNFGHVE